MRMMFIAVLDAWLLTIKTFWLLVLTFVDLDETRLNLVIFNLV